MIQIAVMVSGHGRGSNLQAIIDACKENRINGGVIVVIGVKDDAPAMERARSQGISAIEVRPKAFDSDEAYGQAVLDVLAEHKADLVCLAGYMRILPSNIVSAYRWRIMNIHPALIPLFCGKGMFGEHVHQAALDYGVKVSGCTVHFVDEEYDTGPIIIQKTVPVEEGDTAETLAARVLIQEHKAYPEAIQLFSQGRLSVEGRVVHIHPK
ncbi:MAG: phosphoribosylglycinamide formyltransferase [Candidatus Berkelbacteria bacterium]|nr:phosphoribosylglycinamide formyltransferase [Candidatus Berkelbacteria bacterium]